MTKLSKSKMSDRTDLIYGLSPELEDVVTRDIGAVVSTVVDSAWLMEVRSDSFWAGVKALADLTGVELDDYTRQNLIDPYEGKK